ncbi:site-specific integrase [Clostridium sp. C2-6-12]|uniref:site-specific integrase n=1 Tax=Clostridium sp. C2-6-12 TaxID=2698832 RepID=UPI00136F7646|nr:site-specific integrase [Clostridium sp. C2-6-12]
MLDYMDIDLNNIGEELFNSKEIIDKYRELLNKSNYLETGVFKGINLIGKFEENLWVCSRYLNKGYMYFDFNELQSFKFYGMTTEDINLIKCWVGENIINGVYEYHETNDINISSKIITEYNYLVDFIKVSKNFSYEFIDETTGSMIEDYYRRSVSDDTKIMQVKSILNYITFIEDKFIEDKNSVATTYIEKLNNILSDLNHSNKSRTLPCSKDILMFNNYVKNFFDSVEIPYELKMYYYPIKIWWKLTNIIPFRPSEFCLKISRNSLIKKEDGHYLKIGRLKKKANLGENLLPVLNELKITEDIHEMISYYIEQTNEYGKSNTLFSYPALIHFRKCLMKNDDDLFTEQYYTNNSKNLPEYFTNAIFSTLLNSFYDKVVKTLYNDKEIKEQILPNDTRHFAFTSLILQGLSPVKVAILGGHRTLETLDSYTCSCNTYIDSEVITIIHKSLSEGTLNRSSLKKIAFDKPEICPKHNDTSFKTDIGSISLGYCVADFTNDQFPCKCEECYDCPHWWCPPTEESYNILIDVASNKLNADEHKLDRDIKFMKSLFKKSALVNIDGKICLDRNTEIQLKRASLSVNSEANKLIEMKSNIIDVDDTKEALKLLDDINSYTENIKNKLAIKRSDD